MGALLAAHGQVVNLPSRLLVGRAHVATLRIGDASVSGEHAVLVSLGSSWTLRDLGSVNGTFVNGQQLEPGPGRKLCIGDELQFALWPESFRVIDTAPPQPFAKRLSDGLELTASSDVLGLPSPACPLLQIMPMGLGWLCSGEAGDHPIGDGEVLHVQDQAWRVFLPCTEEETHRPQDSLRVRQVSLTFRVSADEETVLIELLQSQSRMLVESRAHNYLLLDLARRRLADTHLPSAERGWIERTALAQRLHLDPEHLNVQLFRVRRAFAEAGVIDAGNLLECRRRPGQVRIGIADLRIEALDAPTTAQLKGHAAVRAGATLKQR